ncbi:MAG: hypothetical protein RBS77_00650 [Candidatus Moranbacteria bacterium]|jgi:hypothetical protein|nr:hypothetical protein [Candidatus Moranbacteria bacterium]
MKIATGIVVFALYLLFDFSSIFAQEIWQEGETRSKQNGRDIVSVEFTGIEGEICVVGLMVGPNKDEYFSIFYVFPEGDIAQDRVFIDGREREIFLKCDKDQITLFVDDEEFI